MSEKTGSKQHAVRFQQPESTSARTFSCTGLTCITRCCDYCNTNTHYLTGQVIANLNLYQALF